MRVFKTKRFAKWAKKSLVSDAMLIKATIEIEEGSFEANLGGAVLKKRVATKGRGKRGSIRTIVAFKKGRVCFFVYGFEKKEKDNITDNEEKAFKIIAKNLLAFSDTILKKQVAQGNLFEVYDEQK